MEEAENRTRNRIFLLAALMVIGILLICGPTAAQETNQSINLTTSNTTSNLTEGTNTNNTNTNTTPPRPTSNATRPPEPPANDTDGLPEPKPKPVPAVAPVVSFDLSKVLPGDVRIGDSQINILIRNTGNTNLTNLNALITGDGISVYTQEPIPALAPGDSKWILAWINAKKTGKIPLEVRVGDRTFRVQLNVVDSEQTAQAKKDLEESLARRRRIREIQDELANLTDLYETFSRDFILKESKGFVLTNVNLADAKTYLRTAQSALAKDEETDAQANLVLLRNELTDLREGLTNAKPKPRTWRDPLKENIPLFSAAVGALVGAIAVYEKFKKKTQKMKKNKDSASTDEEKPEPSTLPKKKSDDDEF